VKTHLADTQYPDVLKGHGSLLKGKLKANIKMFRQEDYHPDSETVNLQKKLDMILA